jgi:hypothetical protein
LVLVQYAFVAVLVGSLAAAVVTFALMGLANVRRTRRLAGAAHRQGRRFFRDDPYDVPRRYADFALISSGHSPRANNVTDGRLAGRSVRAFDFRCEIGHGTRRMTRHYNVMVADVSPPAEGVLMWPEADADMAPLAARGGDGRVAAWGFSGSGRLAGALASAWPQTAGAEPCIEVRGSVLMVAAPARRSARGYAVSLGDVECLLAAIRGAVS